MDRDAVKYTALGLGFIGTFIAIGLAVGLFLAGVSAYFRFLTPDSLVIPALAVGAFGFGLVVWATVAFGVYGHGTPLPEVPPKHLVTRGPYRHIRNPIYLGWFLGWGGLGVSTGNLAYSGLGLVLLVAGTAYAWIGERKDLAGKHGPEFETWRRDTPAYLPRFRR